MKAVATYVGESGHLPGTGDGSAAFDGNYHTIWRPQCSNCTKNEAWVIFYTYKDVRCVIASDLGKGFGGDQTWNGGIKVDLQNRNDSSWKMALISDQGNSALPGIGTKL